MTSKNRKNHCLKCKYGIRNRYKVIMLVQTYKYIIRDMLVMREEVNFREPELEKLYQKMLRRGIFDKLKKIDRQRNGSS